jgi:hypothetical protein
MKTLLPGLFLLGVNLVHAQQNFINVPSSEVTKAKKIFFQQQFNFNELVQSNTTFDYGLGNGVEMGVNVLGLNFSEKGKSFLNNDTNDVDPYNPLVTMNTLKQLELSDQIAVAFGGQVGLNFRKDKPTYEAGLAYTNMLFQNILRKGDKYVMGFYYNTRHYGGKGTRTGAWFATEVPVINKVHLMAETILGDNALCNSSVGIIYYPRPYLPLTFGFQIPNIKRNSYALVFELTIIPQ